MTKITLERAAAQYAWTLGHDDYPAADQCPYNVNKSRALYEAYWSGWRSAEKKDATSARLKQTAA